MVENRRGPELAGIPIAGRHGGDGAAVAAAGAGLGLVAELARGELSVRPHPVSVFGSLMQKLEDARYRDDRWRGVQHAAIGTLTGTAAGAVLAAGTNRVLGARVGRLASSATMTFVVSAPSGLMEAAAAVGAALDAGDLDAARRLLPALVGRNPDELDEREVVRAVVESVAENTVDAVVAPALWAAWAGAPGAAAYRAVNTMDSMVGHRSERYLRYGWASARADDAANYVPARLCALLVVAARPSSAGAVWSAVRVDAKQHPSPNAGVAEAAFAAALGLRLGGTNQYGDQLDVRPPLGSGRAPEPGDIDRAIELCRDVSRLLAVMLVAAGLGLSALTRTRRRRRST